MNIDLPMSKLIFFIVKEFKDVTFHSIYILVGYIPVYSQYLAVHIIDTCQKELENQ